uniref:Putative salivary mucin 6 n=1 Tax=Aedes aegypti TaxID=7159 RepID=A0A0P6ITM6_AEDAE
MVSSKTFFLGLVICLALVQWNNAKARNGAFRKQIQALTLQKIAKDQGIEPPSQNDTNPRATLRQRLQQKIVDDFAKQLGLSNTTSAAGNSTSDSSNSTTESSNSSSGGSNSTPSSSNSTSSNSNSTENSG